MGDLITGGGQDCFGKSHAGPSACVTWPRVRLRPEAQTVDLIRIQPVNLRGPSHPVAPPGIRLEVRKLQIQQVRGDAATRVIFTEELNLERCSQHRELSGVVASLRLRSVRSGFVPRHIDVPC